MVLMLRVFRMWAGVYAIGSSDPLAVGYLIGVSLALLHK